MYLVDIVYTEEGRPAGESQTECSTSTRRLTVEEVQAMWDRRHKTGQIPKRHVLYVTCFLAND